MQLSLGKRIKIKIEEKKEREENHTIFGLVLIFWKENYSCM